MTTAPSGRQTPPVVPDDDTARASGPGALRGQAWLSLQTHHAQRLLRGRPGAAGKPAIIGLFGFAERLRGIWQGARQDDPYADWWLVKIEDALVAAEQVIKAERATLAERLEALPALEVVVATSRKACRTRCVSPTRTPFGAPSCSPSTTSSPVVRSPPAMSG